MMLFYPLFLFGALRSSTNYSVSAETLDGGGAPATSTNYSSQGSVETAATGMSMTSLYIAQHGYFSGDNLYRILYEKWAVAVGLDLLTNGGPNEDPDGDLLTNAAEYGYGLNPLAANSEGLLMNGTLLVDPGLPIVYLHGSDYRGTFTRRANYLFAGLTYIPQFGSHMVTWTDNLDTPIFLDFKGVDMVSVPYPAALLDQVLFRVEVHLDLP
jgi:hypothetical protein